MAELTITIDTNCINVRRSLKAMSFLEQLHQQGRVKVVKADVLDTELSQHRGLYGRRALEKSAALEEDMGVLVLDHSRLDHARLGEEEGATEYDDIANVLFGAPLDRLSKHQVRDVMLVATHKEHRRDILLTLDEKHLLSKAALLRERYGIKVMTPDKCARRLRREGDLFSPD